jgi:hypothetical protein
MVKKIKDMNAEELKTLKSKYNKKWYKKHKDDVFYCDYCDREYKKHSKSTHIRSTKHKKNIKLYAAKHRKKSI